MLTDRMRSVLSERSESARWARMLENWIYLELKYGSAA